MQLVPPTMSCTAVTMVSVFPPHSGVMAILGGVLMAVMN